MNKGFYDRQLKMLASPLDETKVQKRQEDGRALFYIEGWFAMDEANAIFGYDGWDRQTLNLERLFEGIRNGTTSCAYTARVRITVRAHTQLVVREGTGFGHASANLAADAHERAMKAAETDATKRALATFGGRFGLLLYDKETRASLERRDDERRAGSARPLSDRNSNQNGAERSLSAPEATRGQAGSGAKIEPELGAGGCFVLVTADGEVWPVASPESYCSGLRQFVEGARTSEHLQQLRSENRKGLEQLRRFTELTTPRGRHYADILEALFAERAKALGATVAAESAAGEGDEPVAVTVSTRAGASSETPQVLPQAAGSEDPTIDERHSLVGARSCSDDANPDHEKCLEPIAKGREHKKDGSVKGAQSARTSIAQEAIAAPSCLSAVDGEAANHTTLQQEERSSTSEATSVQIDHGASAPNPGKSESASRISTPKLTPVKDFKPVPAYPLRAITAHILNGTGIGPFVNGDRQDRAAVDRSEPSASKVEVRSDIQGSIDRAGAKVAPPQSPLPTRRSQISGGYSIDKSVLAIPSERRLRSKAHLVMVAAQPCLVCEETPCHAHHVTFAQPRGLSLKVSDEFTVPLCVKHHNEVHAKGNEASWWRGQAIDPLVYARRLWLQSAGLPANGDQPADASSITQGTGARNGCSQ